jgi:hypothetical protein
VVYGYLGIACIPFLGVDINGGLSSPLILCGRGARGALVVSVGRNQECVPACCIALRYKLQ